MQNIYTHRLAGVPAAGLGPAELALEVVNRHDLHHNDALGLVLQVQVPVGHWIRPVELVPFQGQRCGNKSI